MPDVENRLNEKDAAFIWMGEAAGAPMVPIAILVYERGWDSPEDGPHVMEVMARLLPGMRQVLVKDRFSTALPRWKDVPGFDIEDHIYRMPAPGDGTLRAVLEWAEEWSRVPMSWDAPLWRSAEFSGVTVDGVPDRMVLVSQFHHSLMDGQGAVNLATSFYQWGPDLGLPEMPPPIDVDHSEDREHWKQGWAMEGEKARRIAGNTSRRLRWAAANPSEGLKRLKEKGQAATRFSKAMGTKPLSPLLPRTSDRNRFDLLRVELDALKAGARAVGGSFNDAFMASASIAMHRWHLDHGVKVPELRLLMAISTRTFEDGMLGNHVTAAAVRLPVIDTVEQAVKECSAISRTHRDDSDVLWFQDQLQAANNRVPGPIVRAGFSKMSKGFDISLSNVKGPPLRNWLAGIELLESYPLLVGGPAIGATLVTLSGHANLGVVTCPEAITDPENLMGHWEQALKEIAELAPVNPDPS